MPTLHVVILAAGEGTRMKSAVPKVLHPLAGRPLLRYVIDAARDLGASAIHVVHGHAGERVRAAIADPDIHWVEQGEQLGTGHAVDQAMPAIPDTATVLVLYGDVPLIDGTTLCAVVAPTARGEVGLVTVRLPDPAGYGRILRDPDGAVCGIIEECDASAIERRIDEVNTGILASPATALRRWLAKLGSENAQGERYLTDVIAMAADEGAAVRAVHPRCVEEVLGVNDRVQLAHLERFVQRRLAERLMRAGVTVADPARLDVRGHFEAGRDVFLDVNVVVEGRVVLGAGVRVGPNVMLKDCTVHDGVEILAGSLIDGAEIGDRSRIGPYSRIRPGTHLASAVHVGNFVEVKNTSIAEGSKANHLTYLGDSEIGRGVNVGAGTITCNYDGANKHRTVIGDRAFIGSGVELIAPVTVNAGATIGAGSTISRAAPADALTVTRVRPVTVKGWRRPIKKRD